MVNPFKDTDWNPDIAKRRSFAKSLIIGFPVIAAVFQVIHFIAGDGWKPGCAWLAGVGAGIGVVLWLLPQTAQPFYVVWYFISCCIGIVVSNALLGGFYFLAITPVAFVMRLLGRDPLHRKLDRTAATYWENPEKVVDSTRYFRQY